MKRGLVILIGIISMLVQVCMASDYDYLLNSSTITVGQTVGENLMVKEGCPDPDTECQDSEKIRFVSATPGRLGRIEFSINLFKDFDISVNIDDNSLSNGIRLGESITLHTGGYITTLKFTQDLGAYSVDGTSFSSSNPKDTGYSGESRWKGGFAGWQEGYAVNDIRIVVIDGRAEAHINEAIIPGGTGGITLGNPSQVYDRLVVSGIKDCDRLFEIKVRGLEAPCENTQGLYTEAQMNQMVQSILAWGDIDGDGKIDLSEAVHALRVTSGFK